MYDPDAPPAPAYRLTDEQRLAMKARDAATHRRNLAKLHALHERDRRWRRRWQIVLGSLVAAAFVGFGLVVWQAIAWTNGEESRWLADKVSALSLGGVTTTLLGLRMFFGWRRRQRATMVMRAVDATASILPGTR
jgi:hypothetical protein